MHLSVGNRTHIFTFTLATTTFTHRTHSLAHVHTPLAAPTFIPCLGTVGASQCTGWTWNLGNHQCYLKNELTGNVSEPCVSGHTGAGPPLPVPPPSPGPPPPPQAACNIDPPGQCVWYNNSVPLEARRDALVAAMTSTEKLAVLAGRGVDRLHIVADGFNEALHGVAWSGR